MKKRQQELFYIYKFTSEEIISNNYNLNITFNDAKVNGNIVSIGNNQILRQLRNINNIDYDSKKIDELYEIRNSLKSNNQENCNLKDINDIQERIDNILFYNDLINIKIEKKYHYKLIIKNGITINNIKYTRLSCGSGQSRRNSPTFINEIYFKEIDRRLKCGLDEIKTIKEINISKYNSYYGMYSSSVNFMDTPRICIVKDNFVTLQNQKIYYIGQNHYGKHEINIIDKDIELNTHDGMGLISPEFSNKITQKLGLDWHISNWVIRAPFIKGMIVPFDFAKFAKNIAYTYKIKDIWGIEYDINDIDIILTQSQFKMWKYYQSWQQYMYYFNKYNHCFGVCKYNKKEDSEYSLLNYQYIQTLDLNENNINELIKPTIDYINKICNCDKLYTMYFLFGIRDENEDDIQNIENSLQTNFAKAILYDDRVFQDNYIRKKIYSFIETQIKLAKLGRIMIRGNYQMMIADPYALCESIFGLEVKGLLDKKNIYSKWWNDRNVKTIDCCRSPLVCQEEHNIINVYNDSKCEDWYQYIESGIIYNIWDLSTIIHSDSDYDGDIVFSTDNNIIINNIVKDIIPITYQKESAPNKKITKTNIYKADMAAFNSQVGIITNYSTSFFAMLAKYEKDSKEYNELLNRIRLLRLYIGNSIDSAKGCKYFPIPNEWKTFQRIKETDSKEIIDKKNFYNKLVVKQKPYFMRYLYNNTNIRYNDCKKRFNNIANINFGCSLEDILRKNNKTKEEYKFIYFYNKNLGVINTKCIMNILCNKIEDIDFNYKYLKNKQNFDYNMYKFDSIVDEERQEIVSSILKRYSVLSSNKIKLNTNYMNYKEIYEADMFYKDNISNECLKDLYNLGINKKKLYDMIVEFAYSKNNIFAINLLWSKMGNLIIERLKHNNQTVRIPIIYNNKNNNDCQFSEYINIFGNNIDMKDIFNWNANFGE